MDEMESYDSSRRRAAFRHDRPRWLLFVAVWCSSSFHRCGIVAFSPIYFSPVPDTRLPMSTTEKARIQTGVGSRIATEGSDRTAGMMYSRNSRRTYKEIKEEKRTASSNQASIEKPTAVLQNSTLSDKKSIRPRSDRRFDLSPEEQQRSLDRMKKAKRLLQDFTEPNMDEDSAFLFSGQEEVEVDIPTATTTVPDNFWYNGNLLQGGQGAYVTRWANGVKVAEPLRKYDPIATEKRLFSQPGKWLVRNVQIGVPLGIWAVGVVYDIFTHQEIENRRNRAKQLGLLMVIFF